MNLTREQISDLERTALLDGYRRALHGIPLSVHDIGKTAEELRKMYPLSPLVDEIFTV